MKIAKTNYKKVKVSLQHGVPTVEVSINKQKRRGSWLVIAITGRLTRFAIQKPLCPIYSCFVQKPCFVEKVKEGRLGLRGRGGKQEMRLIYFQYISIFFNIFSIYFQYIPVHFQDNVFLEENSKGRRSGPREGGGEQESAT